MKKEILIGTLLVLAVVFLSPAIISLGIREVPASEQKSFGGHKKVYGEITYKTDFTAEENGLLAIGLSFRNFNLQNKKDVSLVLLNSGLEIRRAVINGASISDGGLVKFKFSPIPDSKDKAYQFEVLAGDANEIDALQVFFDFSGSGMNYQLFYKPIVGKIAAGVYMGWFSRLVLDKGFFVVYSLILLGLGAAIIKKKN